MEIGALTFLHPGESASSLEESIQQASAVTVLVDENTLNYCWPELVKLYPALANASLLEVPAGEESKSLEIVAGLWESLAEQKADRNALFINLGGGMVCDLGGFVASTYMRGIAFINLPTSLLAMVDAAIGGKTGIDFMGAKNLIGSFASAQSTIIHPQFLETLPSREFRSGWAEMIKHAIIHGDEHWKQLQHLPSPDYKIPGELIEKSARIKLQIVETDPLEKGERKKLNLGHTFGHALESLSLKSDHPLSHGEAVAFGILAETRLACNLGKCDLSFGEEINNLITNIYGTPPKFSFSEALSFLKFDKKNRSGELRFSLPAAAGNVLYDVKVAMEEAEKAWNSLFDA
jgi:3-dehydroquinate synthase